MNKFQDLMQSTTVINACIPHTYHTSFQSCDLKPVVLKKIDPGSKSLLVIIILEAAESVLRDKQLKVVDVSVEDMRTALL